MSTFEESLQKLGDKLRQHDSVQAYQQVEKRLRELPEYEHLVHEMKAYQQDAVLFNKIDKKEAAHQAGEQADKIKERLAESPFVQDYRDKMQDASDLLQYVTKTLEEKINKELGNV